MANTMNRDNSYHTNTTYGKTPVQKVSIAFGIGFLLLGLIGIVMPGFLGMHLSLTHDLIHIGSGAIALWAGLSDNPKNAYNYCLWFGAVYGLLAIAGFIFGTAGYPSVGHMEADQNLLRIIPNVLEFGTNDHTVHILIAATLLFTAFAYKRAYQSADRSIVDVQRRAGSTSVNASNSTGTADVFRTNTSGTNADPDQSRADLGRYDIDRSTDQKRHSDYENRI